MVYWIILAQIARGFVIWTSNPLGRKVLKTIAVGGITMYLVGRAKKQKELDERRNVQIN